MERCWTKHPDRATQCYRDAMARRATAEADTAQEALTRTGEEKEKGARVNTEFFTCKEWKALGQYMRDRKRNPKQKE